jgi:CRISPR-associated protein Cas2
MTTARALYIAAYDIRDNRRRRLALTAMKAHSTGGQKSVFECFLTESERKALLAEVEEIVAPEDRFFLLKLDPRSDVRCLGVAEPPDDPPFFYLG